MTDEPSGPPGERLQKVLAAAGIGSRRHCEILIEAGRVTVAGEVAILGRRVDAEHDEIALDGVVISVAPGHVHYLLNKPPGVVTTAADPQGRPDGGRPGPQRPAGAPGRSTRPRDRGSVAADQRRWSHPPVDPPVVRCREGVPGRGRGSPGPSGAAPAPRRGRARGRDDRPGAGLAPCAQPRPARDPRGTEPADPSHVRGGRPPGGEVGQDTHRADQRSPARSR